ncbi:MAG: hypothetical protein A2648_01160 [Candidatus Lloydbacteria bacterium RIFCSPHIGHO2_01_FULL_41_20]|uniref:Phosphoribosyltransferase domain-containing protein n=1 Tax=Candidatus Lloydbacteria bacterium RIFCSPHIGHO2_01_FULL_41_20 TaxID=1798657 RepID=A0A1G2CSG9_9BACT|nr:MAG: hypothetical protein A2648_01160 [Candidatus Lloydbacteria bacterium RIFCSPHIGHO2_01_FULL_41_20]
MNIGIYLEKFFNFLFPKYCGKCGVEGTYLCLACLAKIPPAQFSGNSGISALFDYRDPALRKALWRLKYNGVKELAETMGKLLYEKMIYEMSEEMQFKKINDIIVVPIPLSQHKLSERGFNQVALIAEEMLKNDSEGLFSYHPNLLIKNRDTKSQMTIKNRAERLKNLSGSFSARDKNILRGAYVIVIDDITTTGATLNEAIKVLHENGAKNVRAFAVAH